MLWVHKTPALNSLMKVELAAVVAWQVRGLLHVRKEAQTCALRGG